MVGRLDLRRIAVFLTVAYGVSWATALVIHLTGGLADSPTLVAGTPLTLALVLLSTTYMGAPALAHVAARVATREGWRDTWLRPDMRRLWRSLLVGWLGTVLCVVAGGLVFFAIFPGAFDPSLGTFRRQLAAEAPAGRALPMPTGLLLAVQLAAAILFAPLFNSVFAFGEEFGWRAYLQPRLLGLGTRRAMVAMGLIWGLWHWPIIAMGHNTTVEMTAGPSKGSDSAGVDDLEDLGEAAVGHARPAGAVAHPSA